MTETNEKASQPVSRRVSANSIVSGVEGTKYQHDYSEVAVAQAVSPPLGASPSAGMHKEPSDDDIQNFVESMTGRA